MSNKTLKKLAIRFPLVKTRYELLKSNVLKGLSEQTYINKRFEKKLGYKLNLQNPKTFNEKLQWLKLKWKDERTVQCADKYAVRDYIREVCGEELLNELYGVYDKVEDIDLKSLPNEFVLKVTHGSGYNILCKDKSLVDWDTVYKRITLWLKTDFYYFNREWPYKNIKPKIICEKFLHSDDGDSLKDYKIFCFNGVPKFIQVDTDRYNGHKRNIYDPSWNLMPIEYKYQNTKEDLSKPDGLDHMLEYAKKLSGKFPFVRVDFYSAGGKIYFGELTFFPEAGFGRFYPEKYDSILGEELLLENLQ